MKAKFTHVMNDDLTGITFIYFDYGTVQILGSLPEIDINAQFCVHMNSNGLNHLRDALTNELNVNTVFSPTEMEVLKHFAVSDDFMFSACNGQTNKPDSMSDQEWEEFLEKLA